MLDRGDPLMAASDKSSDVRVRTGWKSSTHAGFIFTQNTVVGILGQVMQRVINNDVLRMSHDRFPPASSIMEKG